MTATIDQHQVARLLAAGRLAFGGMLLVAPGRTSGWWLGAASHPAELKALARALGARELVLALGTLRALTDEHADALPWVLGSAAADAVDALATLATVGRHQPARALLNAAVAASAAVAGATAAREIAGAP